jgi:hypothetical protein
LISKFVVQVASTGIKSITFQQTGKALSAYDYVHIFDRKGNTVSLETGVLWHSLLCACSKTGLTPEQYVAKMRTFIEEIFDEEKPKDAEKSE